jgi:hypothetical protein
MLLDALTDNAQHQPTLHPHEHEAH